MEPSTTAVAISSWKELRDLFEDRTVGFNGAFGAYGYQALFHYLTGGGGSVRLSPADAVRMGWEWEEFGSVYGAFDSLREYGPKDFYSCHPDDADAQVLKWLRETLGAQVVLVDPDGRGSVLVWMPHWPDGREVPHSGVICPSCTSRFLALDSILPGTSVRCRKCHQVFPKPPAQVAK